MEEKRSFKVTGITIEANKQIYDGKDDNQIVVIYDEDGNFEWKLSANLHDSMTEGEQKKIKQFAHIVSKLLSCAF